MSQLLDTIVETVLENTECNQTVLDDENTDQISSINEISKQLKGMFGDPKIQNAFGNILDSVVTQLKPKSGILPQNIEKFTVSHDEIINDINERIVPHLLSKVLSDGLNNTQNITFDTKSESYGSIHMLYKCSKYLINKEIDQEQVILYRDRIVGQLVWSRLYEANNFYDKPTDEIEISMTNTLKEFTAIHLDDTCNKLKLEDMFKQFNLTVNKEN